MKNTLILLALAGLAAAACGDDGDDKKTETTPDASVGKPDSGLPVSRGQQISNLAAQCDSKSDCTGSGSLECITDLGDLGGDLAGGYCTAECKLDDECGPKGMCPIANIGRNPLIAQITAVIGGSLTDVIDSQCFLSCVKTEASPCPRADMECASLVDIMSAMGGAGGGAGNIGALLNNFPEAKQTFCFPPVERGDAGVPDAGAPLTMNGMDAGL